jgi:uncharacterized protein (DUF1330 family)
LDQPANEEVSLWPRLLGGIRRRQRARSKAYIAENAKAFCKYGERFLTRGGAYEAAEGQPRSRTVAIEFPSYEAARDCYRSPEYASAMALRQGKAIMDLATVQGYDAPQPDAINPSE